MLARWSWEWKNDGVLVGMEVPPVLVRQAGGLDSQRRLRGRGSITCWFLKDEGGAQLCKAAPDDGRQEGLRMEGRMGLVASSADGSDRPFYLAKCAFCCFLGSKLQTACRRLVHAHWIRAMNM